MNSQTYFDLISQMLLLFSILSLGALAGLVSERVGIVNIAIESQMSIGALVFALAGMIKLPMYLSFVAAMIAGILLSLVHAFTTIKMKSSHIVSGVALNLLVGGAAPFVVKVASKGFGYISTGYSTLKFAKSGILSAINWYFVVAIIILYIAHFIINKTTIGLRFVTTGENPSALQAAGISANKQRWIGLILSGIFAALAGAFFTANISHIYRGSVYGTGFVALAVLIFGKWRIKSIIFASFIFSGFNAVAYYDLEALQFIPRSIQVAMPYVISLIALILFSKNTQVPKAVGKKIE